MHPLFANLPWYLLISAIYCLNIVFSISCPCVKDCRHGPCSEAILSGRRIPSTAGHVVLYLSSAQGAGFVHEGSLQPLSSAWEVKILGDLGNAALDGAWDLKKNDACISEKNIHVSHEHSWTLWILQRPCSVTLWWSTLNTILAQVLCLSRRDLLQLQQAQVCVRTYTEEAYGWQAAICALEPKLFSCKVEREVVSGTGMMEWPTSIFLIHLELCWFVGAHIMILVLQNSCACVDTVETSVWMSDLSHSVQKSLRQQSARWFGYLYGP